MPIEIERKFLVSSADYRSLAAPVHYRQGYLAILPDREIRVRIAGESGFIALKSKLSDTRRFEFEYPVPFEEAVQMFEIFCIGQRIEKYRYKIPYKGHLWEVDEYLGDNAGLVIAEIELEDAGQPFEKPAWVGQEVSNDDRYLNAALSVKPYKYWKM